MGLIGGIAFSLCYISIITLLFINGKATLLWPPHIGGAEEFDDHTVIADGDATVRSRDDGASISVVAYSAVWHRPVRPVSPTQ
jgi:hypothetical protein